MKSRPVVALAALTCAVALLSGCVGEPDPVETTPGFASEEEAFAAAEQTYRNYVDALNQVDLSDPETFEAVYAWTTGDANAADRKSFSGMHADGLTVTGTTRVPLIAPVALGGIATKEVQLAVCLDVTDVSLTRPDGSSAVSANRENVQSRTVTLTSSARSATGVLIESFAARSGEPSCTSG